MTAREGAMGRWPSAPAALEPSVRALLDAGHALACRVVSPLEPRACPSLPPGTLPPRTGCGATTASARCGCCTTRRRRPSTRRRRAALWRAARTPTGAASRSSSRPEPGSRRRQPAAANAPAPRPPRGRRSSRWRAGSPSTSATCSRFDGRLLSNLHVRMPLPEEGRRRRAVAVRYSIAFFLRRTARATVRDARRSPRATTSWGGSATRRGRKAGECVNKVGSADGSTGRRAATLLPRVWSPISPLQMHAPPTATASSGRAQRRDVPYHP